MQPSTFVGRVGALAATLGIGVAAALVGATTASATPAPDTSAQDPPVQHISAERGTPSQTTTTRGFGSQRPAMPAGRRAAPARGNSTPSNPARIPLPATGSRPVVPAASVAAPVVSLAAEPIAARPTAAAAQQTAPALTVSPSPAPAAAQAPAMTVATASVARAVLSPLSGSGDDPLVNSPVSWAVLAVARRQITTTTVAPVAATVRTVLVVANRPPVITNVTVGTPNAATGIVFGKATASDPNGDRITYAAVNSANVKVPITSGGVFTYTPTAAARHAAARIGAPAGARSDTVTVTVTDSNGASTSQSVSVAISPTNTAPVPTTKVGTPNAGTGVVAGKVTATDADADPLTYTGTAPTTKGAVSVDAATGAFTYTPTAAARHAAARVGATTATATDTFTVNVADGYGAKVAVPVTVAVSPKNTPPVAGAVTVGTPNATFAAISGSVRATDSDNDSLTYSAPTTTSKGTVSVNAANGSFTYTPNATARGASAGSDTFTVTVTDGFGGSTAVPVSVSIAAAPKVSYVFNYKAGAALWTPAAKNALLAAAYADASYLAVSSPVTLVFDVTAANSPRSYTLASTSSDLTGDKNGLFNTIVQNKLITGVDTNGSAADGSIDVNFGLPWSYTDTVTGGQYDFTSTMMHEMLHAYGFISYIDRAGYNGYTSWTKFDGFVTTKSGAKVIGPTAFTFNTMYNANLTGGNGGLFFNGPSAVRAYGGPVPLYTPSPWESGSSMSHLNDKVFTGVNSKLMNAMVSTGKSLRTLSTVEIGILKDVGYTVNSSPAASAVLLFVFVVIRRRKR